MRKLSAVLEETGEEGKDLEVKKKVEGMSKMALSSLKTKEDIIPFLLSQS